MCARSRINAVIAGREERSLPQFVALAHSRQQPMYRSVEISSLPSFS
jgi:hypothetical protein